MKIKLFIIAMLVSVVGWGQVNMTISGNYTQDFNTLATTGVGITWAQNSTISNWYSERTGSGTTYDAGTGSSNTGNLYSFGAMAASDRALGAVSSGGATAGNFAHGLLLRNISSSIITNLTISYTGEQWRNSGALNIQTVAFYYKTSSSTITTLTPNNNLGWTPVTALDFTSPVTVGSAGNIDGNNIFNQVIKTNIVIPSLTLASNDYIMIKWEDPDHLNSDHGMAIDDVKINWTVPCASITQWNGFTWTNGTPTISNTAIINANYNTTTHGNIDACSLNVIGGIVTVTSGGYLNIINNVDIAAGGTIDILNNGSLIQDNDAAINSIAAGGNSFSRRDANVKLQDYVYWSSPVDNYGVGNISSATPASLIWEWNPVVVNPNGGKGNWQNYLGAMTVGKGYIVRTPNIVPFNNTTAQTFSTSFSGLFNNGVQTPTIQRGDISALTTTGNNSVIYSNLADNWNLIGNPYPSSIRVSDFLAANNNIEGAVRIWTHGTLPISTTSPFYNTFVNNYTPNDYIVYNGTATTSGPAGFNGLIASGQGFFVVMNDGVTAASGTVTFNNDMRSKLHNNGQFYRIANQEKSSVGIENKEKHRIWLDIVAQTGETARTVVGYVDGATPAKDRMYDAYSSYRPELNIFSLIGQEIMTIQGKGLPFENTDIVPLGIKVPTNGTYTIAINAVDGLFSSNGQTIYLEDKLSNTIHNLSVTPYQFNTNQGVFNDRFVLRYTDAALANPDFVALSNSVSVYTLKNVIKINSSAENIKSYIVYDVLGRTLALGNNVNTKQSEVVSITQNNQALIVKTTLENGQVVTKKIIF